MSTIHRAFNSARSIYYAAAAGQVRVTDLVDGVIAGPDDDPTDAHLRAVLAALLGYVPEATN